MGRTFGQFPSGETPKVSSWSARASLNDQFSSKKTSGVQCVRSTEKMIYIST
jgi:hypothetical protein